MNLITSFDCFDHRLLRTFLVAAEKQNFTLSAQELHMTQSGVSQHIKKLEAQLDVLLFSRVGRRVVLTNAGCHLQDFAVHRAQEDDKLFAMMKGQTLELSQRLSIAMPQSCLTLRAVKTFFAELKGHGAVELDLLIADSEKVAELFGDGSIDIGFLAKYKNNPSCKLHFVAHEELVLVAKDFPENLPLYKAPTDLVRRIEYPELKHYYRQWGDRLFSYRQQVSPLPYPPVSKASCLLSAIVMVEAGLGMSVFPRHCIEKSLEEELLVEIPRQSTQGFHNEVYVMTRRGLGYSPVVKAALSRLLCGNAPKEP